MRKGLLLTIVYGAVFLIESLGMPINAVMDSDILDPVNSAANSTKSETDVTRKQRSPQYGLFGGDYEDYSDYDDVSRHFRLGYKRKFHKPHHKPFGFIGGHGCRGHNCGGGWHSGYGEYNNGHHHAGQGGSFAGASAGSVGGGHGPYGGHSEANAQSASFSFGPYSATFSAAQASSGRKGF